MNFKIFGYTFGTNNKPVGLSKFITPDFSEPTVDLQSSGFVSPSSTSFQLTTLIRNEHDAISQYRDIAKQAEVDLAVEEIVTEMIVLSHEKPAVTLNLDFIEGISKNTKETINKEFTTVLGLLDFNYKGHNYAKRWFIDGRLNFLVNIDEENPQYGIKDLQYIDPTKIKKIRDIDKQIIDGHYIVNNIKEYYIYNENGIDSSQTTSNVSNTITFTTDSIVHANSGLFDPDLNFIISPLAVAIRTVNSLRMVEESGIIYMMTRAPERRIFYIDVGNTPKSKIDQYVKEIADKHRTKILYDPVTGKVRNDKRYLAMTEDFWIPRQGGSRGTEISTLPGGTSFDNTQQLDYFKTQLWDALKVPASRFQQNAVYTHGTQTTSSELRFFRYIQNLRLQFSKLFLELLKRQLILKGIVTIDEFEEIKDNIYFKFTTDNYFAEAVEAEIWQNRFTNLNLIEPYLGKLVGPKFAYKEALRFTDEQIDEYSKDAAEWFQLILNQQVEQQNAMQQAEMQMQALQMQQESQITPTQNTK